MRSTFISSVYLCNAAPNRTANTLLDTLLHISIVYMYIYTSYIYKLFKTLVCVCVANKSFIWNMLSQYIVLVLGNIQRYDCSIFMDIIHCPGPEFDGRNNFCKKPMQSLFDYMVGMNVEVGNVVGRN